MNSLVKKAAISYLSPFCHGRFCVIVDHVSLRQDTLDDDEDEDNIYRVDIYKPPSTRLDAETYYFRLVGEDTEDLDDFSVWGESYVDDWDRVEKFIHVFE